jgi:hypothetical protein
MAKVEKLSGKNCRYYRRGRCTRPSLIPVPEDQLCILIIERKRMGHKTLDRLKRLERFGLTIHDRDGFIAQRYIVNKNLLEMAKVSCKNFIESGQSYPPCINQVYSQCLLKLENCQGRCPDYQIQRNTPNEPRPL